MNTYKANADYYRKTLAKSSILYGPFIHNVGGHSEMIADTYVFAPVVNAFVIWLIQQAYSDGIDHLFFLARDGYSLYCVAKEYCKKYKLSIKCHYLYCSRYSLRIPMYSENISEALDYICRGGIDVTLRKILVRSGFEKSEIEWFRTNNNTGYEIDDIIPYPFLKEVKEKLKSNDNYIEKVRLISMSKWEMLKTYFAQEGLFASYSIGIVDSGWTGTTQKSIFDIRKRVGCIEDIKGYYFGLYEIPELCDARDFRCYYFSPRRHLLDKVFFSNCFFEAILSAVHGTTIGYFESNNKIEPIFGKVNLVNMGKVHVFNDTLNEYTKELLLFHEDKGINELNNPKTRKLVSRLLRKIMWNPSLEEIDYYGSLKFSDDLLDDHMQTLAAQLNEEELFENHLNNRILTLFSIRKEHIHESAWYEASAMKSKKFSLWHRVSFSSYKLLSYIKKDKDS